MVRWSAASRIVLWALVVMGVVGIFTRLQRQMIYYPAVMAEPELLAEAARQGLQAWRDDSGELMGWRPAQESDGARRMLVFHGNAGLALQRHYFVQGFQALGKNWEVFLFEYPGYGSRPGSPSEVSIKTAATRALKSLLHDGYGPVYLTGESLGSGVASHLAGTFPGQVAGLLLVTPFTSLTDVAAHHFSLLPVRALLSERYDSSQALAAYRGPIAFLLAGNDEVVPTGLGQRLHDIYQGPRWLRVIPGAGHNSLPLHASAEWWREVSAFLLDSP